MSAESALARGRLFAAKLFVDACTITRKTGEATNPDTGTITPTSLTIYSGKCKVQGASGFARPSDIGQAVLFLTRMQLHVPVTAPVAQPDDLVTVTACVHDPDMVGRQWHIRGTPDKSWPTAHRYGIEEVVG